jgi:hypothetical protein
MFHLPNDLRYYPTNGQFFFPLVGWFKAKKYSTTYFCFFCSFFFLCFSQSSWYHLVPLSRLMFQTIDLSFIQTTITLLLQWKPLNVITLGQRKTDPINGMITISGWIPYKIVNLGWKNRVNLITLTTWWHYIIWQVHKYQKV